MEPFQFDYLGYMKNMIFIIILMGILAYVLVKLKSRNGAVPTSSNTLSGLSNIFMNSASRQEATHIEVLERKMLEPRKNIYVIRIFGDQYWLVGTTDTQVEALGQLKGPGHVPDAPQPSKEQAAPGAFADYLTQNETS